MTDQIAKTNTKVSDYFQKNGKTQKLKPPIVPTGPKADDTEMIDTSSAPRR